MSIRVRTGTRANLANVVTMRKGDRVLARFEKKQVIGEIVLTTTIDNEPRYFVVWDSGSCWFNAPLLERVTPELSLPCPQLKLF